MAYQIKNILESLRDDVNAGAITIREAAEELKRAGRMNFIDTGKARKLLGIEREPRTVGELVYYPEYHEERPGCDFEGTLSYYGKHYFIKPLRKDAPKLSRRGIRQTDDGYYYVTANAYKKLLTLYSFARECCLD